MNRKADLLRFAAEYHRAAGEAFAKGDDAKAAEFRQAAKDLEAFRDLPDIPEPVRTTRSG